MNEPLSSHNSAEICRVCRSEGTEEQPLFYPCLCSGSIKYIHQDCLIEWLKHSKKRYCELCKHPFTFSPVYAEQMPQKIPLSVLLFGLFKKLLGAARLGLSWTFAALLWFLAVPIVTSQIFRYYFGWSLQSFFEFALPKDEINDQVLETALSVLFDSIQGFLLTGLTVFLILGMMLVREFISMMRHTAGGTREQERDREPERVVEVNETSTVVNDTANETSTVNSDNTLHTQHTQTTLSAMRSPLSPLTQTSPLSPIRRHSEFHRTTTPQSPSGNFWLDQVHPKEYRNYLRRRDLHRELVEAEQNRSFTAQDNELLLFNESDASELLPDDHVSNISGTSTLRSRFTIATGTSGTTAESFRCRVCASNTCISRDHVVQATQIRNSLAAQRQQSLIERSTREITDNTAVNTVNTANPQNTQTPPPQNPENTANNTTDTWNLDAAENLSFPEFFGFTLEGTALLELLQNAAIVVGCNTLVMHLFLFVPFVTGRAVLSGTLFRAAVKVLEAAAMLLIKPESINAIKNSIFALLPVKITFMQVEKSGAFGFALQVCSGYAVLCSLFSLYLNLTRSLTDAFHRVFIPVVSFLGTFIKLITLLFIEMAAFPLACGFIVDYACLPLFTDVSMHSRFSTLQDLPISSLTVHWALGAFFMISFATLVTFLRSFLRPGLLFFLRNPLDPDNHPIKEMVDRPFLEQMYRLSISLVFYALLIGSSIGVSVQILTCPLVSGLVFPLNLKFNDPLIEIPVDLLLQLLLRSLFKSLAPVKLFKKATIALAKLLFRHLKLSSYFLGGSRFLNEEAFPKGGTWVAVPDFDRIYSRARLAEIRARVISPVDISKLKILTDKHGQPVLESSTGNIRSSSNSPDWTVVFRPNYFKLKSLIVIISGLTVLQGCLLSMTVAPLLFGRFLVRLISGGNNMIHEVYSWTLGAVSLLLIFKSLELIFTSKKRRTESEARPGLLHAFSMILKSAVLVLFAGIIWPLQVGCLFSLLVNPLLSSNNNPNSITTVPVIFFGACWSLGFPLLKLLFTLRAHLPLPAATRTALSSFNSRSRLADLNLQVFLRTVAMPVTLMFTGCLILPPLLTLITLALFTPDNTYDHTNSHLMALTALVVLKTLKGAVHLTRRIVAAIRDETYLVGRRLHNLEHRSTSNSTNVNNTGNDIMSPLM